MRAATMRKPAASKRARICPMRFFFTASGLMIERVCSRAISPGSPCKFKLLSSHFTPFRQHAASIFRRLVARVDAEPGNPHQIVAGHDERQPVALPWRHAGLLEEILQRAP